MWQPALFSVLGPSVCGGYEPGTGTGRMRIPVVAWRRKNFFSWFHIALPVGRVALFPCRLKHAKDEAASARAVTLHCRVEMTAPPGLLLLPPAPFRRASAAFLRGHRESFLLKRNEKVPAAFPASPVADRSVRRCSAQSSGRELQICQLSPYCRIF